GSPRSRRSVCARPSGRPGRTSRPIWPAASSWRTGAGGGPRSPPPAGRAARRSMSAGHHTGRRGRWEMTDHPAQLPQPVELPVDDRESALPLRDQLVRFVITGGLSAVVDFGLLVILM